MKREETPVATTSGRRLTEIDSLRGIAAMLVVLFHFTTRYDELFGHSTAPIAALPWGHLGVNLFFMISGFVIFMTLEKTRQSLDFVVSRFSRLYPAYWAAVLLTFVLTHWLGLPGKLVGADTALANLSMVHSFFNIPNVDGVYWTLEIELIFYAWALLAFRLRLLSKIHLLFGALFIVRLAYWWCETRLHVDLPWQVYRLLIIKVIPWFAAGVMAYRLASAAAAPARDIAVVVAAVLVLALVDGPGLALLLAALSVVLYAAAKGSLAFLNNRALVFLGTISYTLYLVHENIGWALMLRLEKSGLDANAAIAVTLAVALLLATLLTKLVEQPAMRWVRERYRQRKLAGAAGGTAPER
jgi:peptidoglycan/LPS O-acetylase OafA/YrhL